MRLLIVEDESLLCTVLADHLRLSGYAVDCAYDGAAALNAIEIDHYDLMILDLNLPELDGLDVLQYARKNHADMRIFVVTARNGLQDRIQGLDLGADDYLAKPFASAELEARVRSLLRREFITASAILECGNLRMDRNSRKVYAGDAEIPLTRTECSILEHLLCNSQKIVGQETLMDHVYDSRSNSFSNVLRVHMHSLRKKLHAALGYNPIITKVREGYYLTPETL